MIKFKSNEKRMVDASEPTKLENVYAEIDEVLEKDGVFTAHGVYKAEDGTILRAIKTPFSLEALDTLQTAIGATETKFSELYNKLKVAGSQYTLNADGRYGETKWNQVIEEV